MRCVQALVLVWTVLALVLALARGLLPVRTLCLDEIGIGMGSVCVVVMVCVFAFQATKCPQPGLKATRP
jgi:hypothetical protein